MKRIAWMLAMVLMMQILAGMPASAATGALEAASSLAAAGTTASPVPVDATTASAGTTVHSAGLVSLSTLGTTSVVKISGLDIPALVKSGKATVAYRDRERILQITVSGLDSRYPFGLVMGDATVHGVLISQNTDRKSTIFRISGRSAFNYSLDSSAGITNVRVTSSTAGSIPVASASPSASPSASATPTPVKVSNPTAAPAVDPTAAGLQNIVLGTDGETALRIVSDGIVARYRISQSKLILDDDSETGQFSFMFPASVVGLGNGQVKVGNALLDSVMAMTTTQYSILTLVKADPSAQFTIRESADGDELQVVRVTEDNTKEDTSSGQSGRKLVVIDPGHGGSDPGAVFDGVYESRINLQVALTARDILEAKGVDLLLTREDDTFVGLDERCEIANDADAAVFVSIHHNSMPSEDYEGTMTMYYPTGYYGRQYAEIMQKDFLSICGSADLGLKGNGNLVVIRKTLMPAILVEGACMSNPDELEKLKTDAYLEKEGKALAQGILDILETME